MSLSLALFLSLSFIGALWGAHKWYLYLPAVIENEFGLDNEKSFRVNIETLTNIESRLKRIEEKQVATPEQVQGVYEAIKNWMKYLRFHLINSQNGEPFFAKDCPDPNSYLAQYNQNVALCKNAGIAAVDLFMISDKLYRGIPYQDGTGIDYDFMGATLDLFSAGEEVSDLFLAYDSEKPPTISTLYDDWKKLYKGIVLNPEKKQTYTTIMLVDELVEKHEISAALNAIKSLLENEREPYEGWATKAEHYIILHDNIRSLQTRLSQTLRSIPENPSFGLE